MLSNKGVYLPNLSIFAKEEHLKKVMPFNFFNKIIYFSLSLIFLWDELFINILELNASSQESELLFIKFSLLISLISLLLLWDSDEKDKRWFNSSIIKLLYNISTKIFINKY